MLSISEEGGQRCSPSSAPNLKAEAIVGALFRSLKGQKDRFGHSFLCLSDSLAFKDVVSLPRFDANTIASVKILPWWSLLCLLQLDMDIYQTFRLFNPIE